MDAIRSVQAPNNRAHTQRERRTTRARGDDLFSWSSSVVYGSVPITTGIRIDPIDRTIVVLIDWLLLWSS